VADSTGPTPAPHSPPLDPRLQAALGGAEPAQESGAQTRSGVTTGDNDTPETTVRTTVSASADQSGWPPLRNAGGVASPTPTPDTRAGQSPLFGNCQPSLADNGVGAATGRPAVQEHPRECEPAGSAPVAPAFPRLPWQGSPCNPLLEGRAGTGTLESGRILRHDPPEPFGEHLTSRAGPDPGSPSPKPQPTNWRLVHPLTAWWRRDSSGGSDFAPDGEMAPWRETSPPSSTLLQWRIRIVSLGVLGLLGILIARLWWLHDVHGAALRGLANRQRVQREPVLPRPGDILDRQGLVLATSVESRSLFVVPKKLPDPDQAARELSRILHIDQATLRAKLRQHREKGFLWVKRRLEESEVVAIRELGWPRDQWGLQGEFRRQHPQGTTAAHVLGQRDIDGRGRGGVEVVFDSQLRGTAGEQSLVLDARGKVLRVEPTPGREVRHGTPLRLTIDTYLQWQAEELLDGVVAQWRPLSACAVVLDPWTGEVLAMASRPTYDPDQAELARPDAWTNRAIHDQYEPGSTFKPLVVAWGLERGVVQRSESFDCENGEWRMGGRVLHDHHRYGLLDVAGILAKSSNIGMAKIGVRLGNPGLHEAATQFGFGQPTGVELPGEVGGLLRPLKKWTRYSTGSIPMGQELSATPLQMAAGFGVLAADGVWMPPHLQLDRPGGVAPRRVITAETARWLREGPLVDVVTKGTGKKAAIPGYAVFGKTGTAQKLDPVTGGYSRSLHVSSFVCGAPANKPRAVVLVSVDQPSVSVNGEHFGGSVAAPAAGQLLAKVLEYYKVPRDTPTSPKPTLKGVADEEPGDRRTR